jgi:nicotinamidase-related amidase
VEAFKGSGEWQEVSLRAAIEPNRTAAVLCDVWDNHWCRGAAGRVNLLAPRIDRFVEAARKRGVLIIHAPSDTMDFYKDAPQRLAILALPTAMPPAPLDLASPPLPIDDSDGGCDTPGDKTHKAWSRQHAAIRIAAGDLVSDKGVEVYNALQARGINHLLVLGVHTNMCILNRTFAIKQMTRWGVRAILVRDLTDAMYDPQDKPFVSHEQGTELVIQHIEKYWCPTVLSADLLQALNRR